MPTARSERSMDHELKASKAKRVQTDEEGLTHRILAQPIAHRPRRRIGPVPRHEIWSEVQWNRKTAKGFRTTRTFALRSNENSSNFGESGEAGVGLETGKTVVDLSRAPLAARAVKGMIQSADALPSKPLLRLRPSRSTWER